MFNIGKFRNVYTGSVKNLRCKKQPSAKNPGVYIFEFTDDYSIFDYGKMPDTIPGKGAAMAMGSAFFFEQVQSPGAWKSLAGSKVWSKIKQKKLREQLKNGKLFERLQTKGFNTHYRGLIDPETGRTVRLADLKRPSHLLEVDAVQILHPKSFSLTGGLMWNYNGFTPTLTNYLVPLECIFRFGLPGGSSLFERIKIPGYLESLGLDSEPAPGDWLSRPVVEFSSKLEPADRYISYETAVNFCGLDNDGFQELYEASLLLSLLLMDVFSKAKVTLWDGKFEFLKLGKGLILGDAITPDELRLTYKGIQISKEPLRQYYRSYEPAFVEAMKEAKVRSKKTEKPLHRIVNDDLKCPPPPLNPEFRQAMAGMYTGLTAMVSGSGVFDETMPMTQVLKAFRKFNIV